MTVNKDGGDWFMRCGQLATNPMDFDPARHGKNYNTVFCDGHVAGMDPWVLFNPGKTAPLWNYDHQPHPELWTP
jgi:prepilin-type processing-associated H-X9-DG protein